MSEIPTGRGYRIVRLVSIAGTALVRGLEFAVGRTVLRRSSVKRVTFLAMGAALWCLLLVFLPARFRFDPRPQLKYPPEPEQHFLIATADLTPSIIVGRSRDVRETAGEVGDLVVAGSPQNGIARFREQWAWDRYRPYVVGIFLLLILQASLIVSLLLQRGHRQRAEERLRSEKAFSDAVIEGLPGIFFMQDDELQNVRWNKNAEKIVRPHPSQTQVLGDVAGNYRDLIHQKAREVLEQGDGEAEIELLGQRGTRQNYHINARRVYLEGKRYAIGIGIDISGRKRAEEELRLSEARFSTAFEYAPIGVALVADDGHWIKVNRALCDLLGYTAEELQAMRFQDVTHPDDLPPNLEYTRQIFAGEVRSYALEKRYIHKSGRVVWASLSVSLVRDSQGQPLYRIAQIQDITERKRAEDQLRLSEARFSSAFEYAPIGVALIATDGSFVKVNRALCDMLGYSSEELLTKSVQQITHPDDWEGDQAQGNRMLAGEISSYQLEKRNLHKSGRVIWIGLSVSLVRDREGQPLYFISQIQDITERKRAEQELKMAEERFAKAFHNNPGGFSISLAPDGRYLEANESFLRMLGYERSELIGKTSIELGVWVDIEERNAIIAKIFAQGSIREEHVRFRTKSGEVRQIRLSAEIIRLQGEQCLLGLSRDVTAQNLLEDRLRQAQKLEAIGRLAGGVAHDFNNLLGVIIGYSDLISSALPAESSMYNRIEAIKQAGQRATSLTTQLLAFSRKQTLQPSLVNLNSVVTETSKLLLPLMGEDVQQTVNLDENLGAVRVDGTQIVQVLINLAVNARDAMPNGGKLVIETRNAIFSEEPTVGSIPIRPGSYVTLSVKDSGIGMDEGTASRIFDPFFTTKSEDKGTGLGLATVYGIVEQSGGIVVVDTAPGKGSTFTIYLPQAEVSAKVSSGAQDIAGRGSTLPSASGTILLVEDEIALRGAVDESLREEGYNVLVAANGSDALQMAKSYQHPIQLLITDVIMPFMSGPELAQSLRALQPAIRVLYTSGYTADRLPERSMSDPELALLQKPFDLADLLHKVRDILSESGARGASAKG